MFAMCWAGLAKVFLPSKTSYHPTMKPIRFVLLILIATAGLCAQATHIKLNITQNPPPAEKFSAFTSFEMPAVVLGPPYSGDASYRRILGKIQENVSHNMSSLLPSWNAAGVALTPKRTLLIESVVTEIKFVSGTKRFWLGPILGSSAVILNAKITDKETGKVVASPVFYARAQAMGGTFTIGATDNLMLTRIARDLTDYLVANFSAAIGGPTGAK
jgi:hypothetical protein